MDFKLDKNNGLITDIIIDHEKYLIACNTFNVYLGTKKGYVGVFSMVLESKLGYLFTDF